LRRVRYSLLLIVVTALGGSAYARPIAAQDVPTSLPTCSADDGETLDGSVTDRATGVPLAGADVVLSGGGRTRTATTVVDGRFRFCSVSPSGRAVLRAEYAAVASEPQAVVGGNRGQPVQLVLDLGAPSTVGISVTDADSGEPIEGVTIRLEPGVIGAITNETGTAGLGQVPPGDYELRTDHVAYHPSSGSVFIVPDRTRQLEIALSSRIIELDTLNVTIAAGQCAREGFSTLSGKVIDRRTKIPLEDASVSAGRFQDGVFSGERAQTDEDGSFLLCGVPDDARYVLLASLGSRRSEGMTIRTGRARGAIVLEIDFGEPAFLVVRVTDGSTGFPVEGAMLRLRPHPLAGITDAKGLTGFPAIPPGEYEVRVDHIAFASFEATMQVKDGSAEEYEIELRRTAITVAPLEVRITGRDPVLINTGFYDRMAELDEGAFYDYWDMESFALLSTFFAWKGLLRPSSATFINGRPLNRSGYEHVDEIPFSRIRGVEIMRCKDLPAEMARYFDLFDLGSTDCWATLIWRGNRRVRHERERPTDRCADERRAETLCSNRERR